MSGGAAVSLVMRVKTVNTSTGGEEPSVVGRRRDRLRWIQGVLGTSWCLGHSVGSLRCGKNQLRHAWVGLVEDATVADATLGGAIVGGGPFANSA